MREYAIREDDLTGAEMTLQLARIHAKSPNADRLSIISPIPFPFS